MRLETISKLAKEVAGDNGFEIDKIIYKGTYYSQDNFRNIIYAGKYQGKKAVLKYYDDPRLTDEPVSLKAFLKNNKSKLLKAPELYEYKILSPQRGWLIEEMLPEGSKSFNSPMSKDDRSKFLDLFIKYRSNFPEKPTRDLVIVEKLPASEFYNFRLNRWFEIMTKKEVERQMKKGKAILDTDTFIPLYVEALHFVNEGFKGQKMIWCHGHFKPHELFKVPNKNQYYLIDFAHTSYRPHGYEYGFIVWADYLLGADWHQSYSQWKQGVLEWRDDLVPVAERFGLKNPAKAITVSIVERSLASILADIVGADRPRQEQLARVKLFSKLIKELMQE